MKIRATGYKCHKFADCIYAPMEICMSRLRVTCKRGVLREDLNVAFYGFHKKKGEKKKERVPLGKAALLQGFSVSRLRSQPPSRTKGEKEKAEELGGDNHDVENGEKPE